MKITVLLADDHEIFRQGLHLLLSSQPDFKVVGQAGDGLEAIAQVERLRPNILIVDMLMPGLNGIDVSYQVHQRLPGTKVIVLSMHDDESYVITALKSGATAYVLKDSSTADLVQAVRTVMAGRRFLSPPIIERAIDAYINRADVIEYDYNKLTSRELEVLRLSVESLSTQEIAERLTISVRTVETHRSHLMHKLDVHSQEELVAYAQNHKIVT